MSAVYLVHSRRKLKGERVKEREREKKLAEFSGNPAGEASSSVPQAERASGDCGDVIRFISGQTLLTV